MKSLFPNLEVYKEDADVGLGDIPKALIREFAELFKKYGFSIRFTIQSGQERERE